MKKQKTTPADPPEVWQKSPVPNLIRYVPSGVYFARVRVGGKLIRRSLKTNKFSVAQLRLADFAKDQRGNLEALEAATTGKLTFSQAEAIYLDRLKEDPKLKPATRSYRERMLANIHKSWPSLAASDTAKVTPRDCATWAVKFRPVYSPTVFNNAVGTLRQVFAIASELGARYNNPVQTIKRTRVRQRELKLPSRAEFLEMVSHVANAGGRFSRHCAELIQFLAYGGFRKGEAALITWGDCDFKKSEIFVRGDEVHGTKNWTSRRVPMIPAMKDLLAAIRKDRESTNPDERVMKIQECQKSIDGASKALKIQRITHHDLRHLFATTCIEAGVDIPTVSRWLGHKDGGALAMKVYGHLRDAHSASMAQLVCFNREQKTEK